MTKPNLPIYGLAELNLFQAYQTRDEYERLTGQPCPVWDTGRPPKYWFDPAAAASTKRTVVYDLAVFGLRDGKPELDLLVLSKEHAATVNIPPFKWSETTDPAVPVPLRALDPDEELIVAFGGVVQVKNTAHPFWGDAGGFTASDRTLLKAIAKKLGV